MFRAIRQWFDPGSVHEHGTQPDYRFSLANERTFLAWIRTALSLVGGGLAIAAVIPALHWPRGIEVVAIVPLAIGGAVAIGAVDHWARSERAMRLGEPLPRSRFPALLSLSIGLSAAALIIALLVGAFS